LHWRFGGPQNGLKNKEEFIIKKFPLSVHNKECTYYVILFGASGSLYGLGAIPEGVIEIFSIYLILPNPAWLRVLLSLYRNVHQKRFLVAKRSRRVRLTN
jgi:hypothetical protein